MKTLGRWLGKGLGKGLAWFIAHPEALQAIVEAASGRPVSASLKHQLVAHFSDASAQSGR